MSGTAFQSFVAPARARPALWRLIAGLALGAAIYLGFVSGFLAVIRSVSGPATAAQLIEGLAKPVAPGPTLLLFGTFAGMLLGVVAAARVLQRRGPGTLVGPRRRVLRDFLRAAGIAGVVYGLSILGWTVVFDAVPQLDPARWLRLLPLALAGVALQTLAEEMVFRGYLQQQLAARFAAPLIWLLLPAALFGAVHYDPAVAGENALLVVLTTGAFGLAAADLTARTGSLGAAWGLHFANNVFAILILATQGTIEGLALFLTPYSAEDGSLLRWTLAGDLAVLAITWAAVRRAVG